MSHDRLAAHGIEVENGADAPALGLGVVACSAFVVLGALTLDLVLGRDPNPDADLLFRVRFLRSQRSLHCDTSMGLRRR
jgi:hypothetical protein